MTILDIEARSGLPRASVRFYEKKGFLSPERGANGYREYSGDDLLLLKKIKLLRQLGIPLSDIQAMHCGQAEIACVVQARIAEIAAEQERQTLQHAVCGEILDACTTYADLDIERYLEKLKGVSNTSETHDTRPRPKAGDPWRRMLARLIDLGVYCLLFNAFTYYVQHRNAQWRLLENLALCCFIMLVIEPPLLSLFKTTPGKLLFGIRVTDYDDERLSIFSSYARFYGMLSRGLGFAVIPVYNVYRLYRSYKDYIELGETKWDEDHVYTIRGTRLRTVAGVLCLAAIAVTLIVSPYAADMPKHRGDITLEQFTENVNRNMYYNYINESIGWRYDGVFGVIADPPRTIQHFAGASTLFRRNVPGIDIVESGGFVTEVTLTNTEVTGFRYDFFINDYVYPLYNAFALAQDDIDLFTVLFGNARSELRSITESEWGKSDSHVFIVGDIEVAFRYDMRRGGNDTFQPVYDIYFSMKKTA